MTTGYEVDNHRNLGRIALALEKIEAKMPLRLKVTDNDMVEIKDMIEAFVDSNFQADGCRECHEVCHEIIPDDHKGSYDKATKELIAKLYTKIAKTI